MALCSLLRLGNSAAELRTFAFEHAMASRVQLGCMSDLSKLSVLPYQIDPMVLGNGKYRLDHQQSHLDAMVNIPVKTIPFGENLIDTTGNWRWWTFANHQEHLTATNLSPALLGPYPFW